MQLHHQAYELRLRDPFRIAKGVRSVQPSVILALGSNGRTGYGEASAINYYGQSTARTQRVLEMLRPKIEASAFDSPAALYQRLLPYVGTYPFVQAALDVAAHDLHARLRGVPLQRNLLERLPNALYARRQNRVTSFTIGIDTAARMIEKIVARPWPVYKIKLGTDDDLGLLRQLRAVTNSPFRVDANEAWTAAQTIDYSKTLQSLGVELIEQPLPAADWEGMREVVRRSHLPVIADESCQGEADVARCAGHFHGINLKLSKCGGLTPALRMIAAARAAGLLVMAGCMVESTVGIAPLAHLLPLLDYVDMDGPLLLTNDPATGIDFQDGGAVISARPGTGVSLRSD